LLFPRQTALLVEFHAIFGFAQIGDFLKAGIAAQIIFINADIFVDLIADQIPRPDPLEKL